MNNDLSSTAQAVITASDARDAAMLAAFNAAGTHREAEMDAAYDRANNAYLVARDDHRDAKDAWAAANPRPGTAAWIARNKD